MSLNMSLFQCFKSFIKPTIFPPTTQSSTIFPHLIASLRPKGAEVGLSQSREKLPVAPVVKCAETFNRRVC